MISNATGSIVPLSTPTHDQGKFIILPSLSQISEIAKLPSSDSDRSPIKEQIKQELSTFNTDREDELFSLQQSPIKQCIFIEPISDIACRKVSFHYSIDTESSQQQIMQSPVKIQPKQQYPNLKSNIVLQQKQQSLVQFEEFNNQIPTNQPNSRKIPVQSITQIFEEKDCKYCKEADTVQNFVRPCLCRGSMQHVHQKCLQQDIEQNYMDEGKIRFVKDLVCDVCKFKFIVKSYRYFSYQESMKNPIKQKRFQQLSVFLFVLLSIFVSLIIIITLNSEQLKRKIDIMILMIVICIVCLSVILVIIVHICDLLANFNWKILDRNEANHQDRGIIVNFEVLNQMLENARHRWEMVTNKILPN